MKLSMQPQLLNYVMIHYLAPESARMHGTWQLDNNKEGIATNGASDAMGEPAPMAVQTTFAVQLRHVQFHLLQRGRVALVESKRSFDLVEP